VSIHCICPHCGVVTDIADKFAGETGPCAHCGKAITIPNPNGLTPHRPFAFSKRFAIIAGGGFAGLLLGVLLLLWTCCPPIGSGREAAMRMQCLDNLKRIALAMQEYEAANGCFPPAYVADKDGRPMYSWRTLLLPYLGEQALYDQYRFNEPWFSPYNRDVTDVPLEIYQCPAQPNTKKPTTSYMMVVGPNTISNGRGSRQIPEITDGLAETILLVEVADSQTHWADPQDLDFQTLDFQINETKGTDLSSYHRKGVNVAFCNGSVHLLKNRTDPKLVEAMLTVNGGESTEKKK